MSKLYDNIDDKYKDYLGKSLFVLSLFVLGLLVYLFVTKPFLHIDERFTMGLLDISFKEMVHLTAIDVHPPLYYALLHTISSFFADDFSWWWAFAINLAAFVISQIFLYQLVLLVGKDRWCALLVCLLWGFSMAGQNTQLFLRMYSMLTMFVIVFAWKLLKSDEQKEISVKKDLLPLLFVSAAASLTQHLFLLIAFFLTLFSLFWMAGRKELKKLLTED